MSAREKSPEYLLETRYPLTRAKVFEIHSEKTGRTYKVLLSLPGSYDTFGADTRYPVLYTVDGQWHFSIAQATLGGIYNMRTGAVECLD